ncbi:MAG TPA: hypothetical protein PKW69_15890, partial [Niabella sp.]|nr:hypothetical protein [Niabella sp.]
FLKQFGMTPTEYARVKRDEYEQHSPNEQDLLWYGLAGCIAAMYNCCDAPFGVWNTILHEGEEKSRYAVHYHANLTAH